MQLQRNPRALAVAMLTLAACGEKPQTQAPRPSETAPAAPSAAVQIDACQLLTKQEVEAALGSPVGDPKPESASPIFGCKYEAPAAFAQASVSVVIFDSPKQARDAFEMAVKVNDYQEVPVAGERAYGSSGFGITVLKGRYELNVGTTPGGADRLPLAKQLAEKALARLP